MNKELIEKINNLKTQKKAIILAHVYQLPEIQDIADYVGDSLGLSQQAANPSLNAKIIVFCGVTFMAETAALLSPEKKVLLPDLKAGCPMADMAPAENVKKYQEKHPDATTVCYVNSTVEVKALSDICVTSSNAAKIVKALPAKQILFVPDQSLGDYVAKQVPEKEIILYPGFCPTHHRILEEFVTRAKEEHPQALLLAHPECRENVLNHADFIGSTGKIEQFARESDKKEFIIASENGMIYRLEKENPDKKFYSVSPMATCQNMKKITLEKVLHVLETEENQITVSEKFRDKALAAINKMLELS